MSLQNKQLPTIQLAVNTPAGTPQKITPPNMPVVPGTPVTPVSQTGGATAAGPTPHLMGAQLHPTAAPAEHDPAVVDYYTVMVDQVIREHQTTFVPGRQYHVSPHIYLSKLEDGSTFASHCAKVLAQPKV